MSPRYKPKTKAEEREAFELAAREYSETRTSLDDVPLRYRAEHALELREAALARQGLDELLEDDGDNAYSLRGPHSYFRDLAASAADAQSVDWMPHPQHGGAAEARDRLATVKPHVERARINAERRTLSTVATAGGDFALNFTPTAAPGYVGRAFATAVRNKARLAQLLHHEPLPDPGVKIETARITTGTTAAVQTADNAAGSNQDLVEALVTSNLATIFGYEDLSQQLLDNASPSASIDVVLAADLGAAVGTALDSQILYGTGANGQLRGFVNVSGITTVTKTNAAPTGATNLAAIGNLGRFDRRRLRCAAGHDHHARPTARVHHLKQRRRVPLARLERRRGSGRPLDGRRIDEPRRTLEFHGRRDLAVRG